MSWMGRLGGWSLIAALLLMAGCASAPKSAGRFDAESGPWSGRLALQVEDKPEQSFSAGFELKGAPRAGELTLFSPLGGTLAVLVWQPDSATLRANGDTRHFESVDALIGHVTGTPIPVAALFDWLKGINTSVAGWHADLSQLAQGRLAAKRLQPVPQADLRVVLER